MGHRTWDKSDQTGLIGNLPGNDLESPSGEKQRGFKECQKETKTRTRTFASPHHYHRESRGTEGEERRRREETEQGRIPEVAGAYKMGAHIF